MIYVRSRVWFRVLALLLESFGRLTGSTGGWQVAALRQERQAHDSGVTSRQMFVLALRAGVQHCDNEKEKDASEANGY
jgi:hypothetical protein